MHLVQAADALTLTAAGIKYIRTGIELTRINAYEAQTADERIGSDLERQTAERILYAGMTHFLRIGLGIYTPDRRHIERRRQECHHIVKQLLHALVVERRAAKHRHELHGNRSFTDRSQEFVGSDRIGILEEFLHQRIVRSGDFFDELGTPFGSLGLHRLGNLANLEIITHGLIVEIINRVIIYKVYQTFELVLDTDRKNDRKCRSAEVLLDLRANGQEIGTRTVHLIDVTDTRHIIFVGLTPNGLRLGLHTAYGTERGDSAVQHAERTLHLDRKIDVSRGIDQVDLILVALVLPESGRSGRSDRNTALLLLHHPVHRGATFVHLADLVRFTRVEKNSFRGGRFTGIDVSHDTDIASIS